MEAIIIPKNYNYIGAFLTFACNLKCSYCINYFEDRPVKRKTISGKDWVEGLNRLVSRDDMPVTLQGGEPSFHRDFLYIINNLKPELNIDILTNMQFDEQEFMKHVHPDRVKRNAPYASIRVSYHPEEMDLDDTIRKVKNMLQNGFSVGIWGVTHPKYEKIILEAQEKCRNLGIDFRTKEFLGEDNGSLYGNYRYEGACARQARKMVQCRTTELLIDSAGSVFRCHADLYACRNSIGHILDPKFKVEDRFRNCDYFGYCNPCDVKIKNNRFQQYGHTSVEIKLKRP